MITTAEQIPEQVVEKVAKCLCDEEGFMWDAYPDVHQYWKREARKLIVAAINAWPEACSARDDFIAMSDEGPWLILPIREKRDDTA